MGEGRDRLVDHFYFRRLVGLVRRNLDQQPVALVLALYLFFLALDSVVPFDVSIDVSSLKEHLKAVNVMPFGYRTLWGSSIRGDFLWVDLIGDALYVLPFGFLLGYCYCRYWRGKRGALIGALCLGGLSHLSLEVGQLFIASRVSDINDVLSGLLGTALGTAAFALACGTQGDGGRAGLGSWTIYPSLMAINLVLMGLSALKPFAFSFDPGFLSERLSSFNLVPLLPYFYKTDFGALEDLLKTFLYPLPLGYVLGSQWQAKGIPETCACKRGALVGLALGGLLELAQLAIVSKSPDLTDAVVSATGAWAGTSLWYRYRAWKVQPDA